MINNEHFVVTSQEARKVVEAIMEHAEATERSVGKVLEEVVSGLLVVVHWKEGQLTLLYSSPNGL
ncbi:MAG TPA: hypothetical protein VJC14_02920 [Candidatus Paceibacterota bacterium]